MRNNRSLSSRPFNMVLGSRPKARKSAIRRTHSRRGFFEQLEDRRVLALYVGNVDDFSIDVDQGVPGLDAGDTVTWNPGAGSAHGAAVGGLIFGSDAFDSINAAITAAPAGEMILVAPGEFNELVNVNKQVILLGNQTGVDARDASRTGLPTTESVVGNTGSTSFYVTASDAVIDGFTVEGNTSVATFNFGILLGAGTSGSTVSNNIIQNNIAGLGLSNANGANPTTIQANLFRNNNQPGSSTGHGIYTDNSLAGGTVDGVLIDNNTFEGNDLTGIGFSSTSAAAPATNITVSNNVFDGNGQGLYAFNLTSSEILNNTFQGSTGTGSDIALLEGVNGLTITGNLMQGGAGRALGTSNASTGSPNATGVVFNWNSVTGYAGDEVRVGPGTYNGTLDATRNWWGDITGPTIASNPGGAGSSIDDAGGQVNFQPWLVYGDTDADPVAPGLQLPTSYTVPAQTSDFTATNNNYRRLVNMIEGVLSGQTVTLTGVFDWTESEAIAAWALGNDGLAATNDDYSLVARPNLTNVTITANALGDARIQGPGDLDNANLEGVFTFEASAGDYQNWVISNLEIFDFDLSIGMFFAPGNTNAFNNFQILDNHIRIPADLNSVDAPVDVSQNIAIHFSHGANQTISGNIIDIDGTGVSNGLNFSSSVGMQSNTSGGTVYDGLVIENNTLRVLGAQSASPANILGIWENGHAHQSDIVVRNNSFLNTDAGNNPALNLQKAFRVTSHSGVSTTVTYEGNTVEGANIGFQWISGSNFAANQAVRLWGNTLTDTSTAILVQSDGIANLYQNTITGSLATGVDVQAGTLTPSGAVINAVEQNVITGGDAVGIILAGTSAVTGGIFNNDLSGNAGVGIDNQTASLINASGNWWGSNVAADVVLEIIGSVDYSPWLDVGTDIDGATPGFQGDFSVLHVDDSSPNSGAGAVVQEGIDLATGSTPTVLIEPGIYPASIVANKAGLVLDGVTGNPPDVQVSPLGGIGITVTADDVTIRDLRIVFTGAAIVAANLNEITLVNLQIDGNAGGGSLTNVATVNFTTGDGDETIEIDDTGVSATGVQEIALSGVTTLNANGGDGSDTFNVIPSAIMAINVLGGSPAPPALPGDTLNVDTTGTTNPTVNSTAGPNGYQGEYTFADRMTVTFDEIETLGTTADIAVTKVESTDPVTAGTNLTYTITVENVGGINATNITLSDVIPANATFVSFVAAPGWTITTPAVGGTGTVEATIADLAAGSGVQTFTLVINVNASALDGSTITNTATVTTDPADSNPANDAATETTTVQAVADVSVTKTGPTAPAVAGGTITYTIVVTNNGVSDAQNVTLVDLVPTGTTFVSFTDLAGWTETTPAVGGTGTVSATIPTLAAGSGPQTFILVVMANSDLTNGSLVNNSATVTTDTTDADSSNDSAATTTVVLTSADLTVTKIDTAQPVVAGEEITYTITVNNHGLSDAQGVTLMDVIPAGTTFVSLTGPAGWLLSTPPVGGTGTISATLPTLAAGSAAQVFTLVVRVDSSLPAGANIANTVTIGSLTADPDPGNNFSTENTPVITAADLSVIKSDSPDPVIAGDNITYTIIVTNNGGSDAHDVSLSDLVPAGTTFVSFASPGGWSSTTPAVGGTGSITSTIATLPAGATATFTLVVATSATAADGTNVSNTATLTSATTDPDAANNSATESTIIVTSADLSITKTDDGSPVIAGEDITYTIVVTNNGVNDAQTVNLSDLVPAGATFVSFVAPAGWTFTAPAVGSAGTVTASTATFAAGASATFTLVVRVNASAADGSTISNTATVASATTDPVPANNSATETTTVATSADLSVTKADDSDPVLPGQNISYTIVVTNNGSSDAQSVTLSDVIPAGTTFVSIVGPAGWSITAPAVGGTGTITATNTTLAAGQSATFTLVVMVDANVASGTTITNTATVASVTTDGNASNNTASATTTISSPGLPDYEVVTLNGPGALGTAVITPDLDNPGQFILLVTGTANADYIVVQPRIGFPGQVTVTHNGLILGNFADSQFTRIVVYGLAGNDYLVISPLITKSALLFGGVGSDSLLGGSGDDGIDGGAGNDIIYGGAGNDIIIGGDGNDLLLGQDGDDIVLGGDGVDVLYGDAGNDFLRGGDGIDFLYGGENNDRLYGESGNDVVYGEGGNDIVSGGSENDTVSGGNGRDLVLGGAGLDTVFGDPQEDIVVAGTTTHDTDEVALAAILAEWLSSNSYVNRVNNIRFGGGANGPFVFDSTTVDDDGDIDLLWGLGGQDWFLLGIEDFALDRAIDELVN